MAEQKGTLAPQAILTEIVDLDGRVVDLMDDAAASSVSLREYLDFYAHLDVIPELADKQLAELTLREALWSIDQASTFDENPPACPAGLSRVVSQSGLNSFCRLPAARMTAIRDSDVASHSEADNISGIWAQPNIKGLLGAGKAGSEIDAILLQISANRMAQLDKEVSSAADRNEQLMKEAAELNRLMQATAQEINRLQSCSLIPKSECDSTEYNLLIEERAKAQARMDTIDAWSQLNKLELHSLLARRRETFASAIPNVKMYWRDAQLGFVTPIAR